MRPVYSCLILLTVLLAGCATLPPGTTRSPRDPWERMNRATFKMNYALDKAVLRPVARGYQRAVPRFMQTGFRNFMSNLGYPVVMVNDVLQGEFRAFGNDTARLLLNTIWGLGGLFDPATTAGLDKNYRDFGQTVGKWGLKTGPYFVIPFLGPSDVRDGFGRLVDEYSDPRHYIRNRWWNWGLWTVEKIDNRALLLSADQALDTSYDPYAFMRNVYLQNRDYLVNGGRSVEQDEEEDRLYNEALKDMEESKTPQQPAAPQGAPPPGQAPENPTPQQPPPPQ
ncbi:MAG TPA: VacJ family lipoprotein [Steroidobacteraceae bacterium]|nr:VacJ family lipoprotein [Steroidobacteraceae bacterium]